MKIEDVSLREVQQVYESNRNYVGRARSPQVLRLIETISAMKPGVAMSITVEEGKSVATVRTQVFNAAKVIGKRVEVVPDEENRRVMFALTDRPPRTRRSRTESE